MTRPLHQLNFLTQLISLRSQQFIQFRIIQPLNFLVICDAFSVCLVQHHFILIQVINTLQALTHANRPGHRRALNFQHIFDFIQQINRVFTLTIQLVDKGHNRRITQATNFHQLDGAFLDAFRNIDHHQRRIHRRQYTVSIFREVFMAGSIQQIDDTIVVRKLHHR